jgi:hypothetical protein
MLDSQLLVKKLMSLPPARIEEVADFIDFLASRERETALTREAAQASAASFGAVWRNPEDDVYDEL